MTSILRCVLLGSTLVAVACGGSSSGGGGGDAGGAGGSGGGTGTTCTDVCPTVYALHCSQGPPTEADCVSGCEAIRSGPCAAEYSTLLSCAGTTPSYVCSVDGYATVVGCETQTATLNTCLASH